MDPINRALGVSNVIYFVASCHAGQVVNDYAGVASAPTIIPESRAELPSYGFTEGFDGGDVQQLFFRPRDRH